MDDIRILVAEDDPVFRRVIVFTLKQLGFVVDAVSDGHQAIELLQQGRYDLLVTDHQMPQCSGLELIERLRDLQAYAQLPVILCTARGLELDKRTLLERYQLADIMHKPFSPRLLADKVRHQVQRCEASCATH
ncbi:MAG: response regulator [Pirellulaceae bacterium]